MPEIEPKQNLNFSNCLIRMTRSSFVDRLRLPLHAITQVNAGEIETCEYHTPRYGPAFSGVSMDT